MNERSSEHRPDELLDDSIPMLTEVVPLDAPAVRAPRDAAAALPPQAEAREPMKEALRHAAHRVGDALSVELQATLRTALEPTLNELLRNALEDALRDALEHALRDAVRSTLEPVLQDAARIAVEAALRDAAFLDASLGSAAHDGPEARAALAPACGGSAPGRIL